MYTITLMAHADGNAPFKKTKGWEINPAYEWMARMDYSCDSAKDAYEKADMLRRQFWLIRNIGENLISKYKISIEENGENKMFSEFSVRGSSFNLTSKKQREIN